MKKGPISTFFSVIIFSVIYFSASLVLLGSQYRPLPTEVLLTRYFLIFVFFSIIIFIYLKQNGLTVFRFPNRLSMYLFLIWVLFSLAVIFSEIIHQTFPVQGLFFLTIVPFIYFTVMPYITKISGLVIHHSLFAANLLYIVLSYVTYRYETMPYSGIAANPNGFGQIAAISAISGFFILITLTKKRRIISLLIIAGVLLSIISVILSSSRTSFLVVGAAIMLISMHYMIIKRNIKPFVTIIVICLIGWFSPLKDVFLHGLFEKFISLNQQGNVLNGRTGTWQVVTNETTLFGHGEDYFQHFFEGAHNSIINILGIYGIVPAILLTCFLVLMIVVAVRNTLQHPNDRLSIFPLVIIVTFILFSLTEAMFGLVGNGITIAFYHVVGLLLFKNTPKTISD